MYPNPPPYLNAAPAPSYAKQFQYVKDFLKRPIAYITVGLLTVQFIFSVISAIINRPLFASAVKNDGVNTQIFSFSLFFGSALVGILVVGAWLACVKSANKNPLSSPSAGLTIIKIISIIYIVIMSMALVIILLAMIIAAAASSSLTYNNYGESAPFNNPAASSALIVLAIVIILLVFGVVLFYYISLLRFVSSIKGSLRSPLLKSGGSLPFAVFSIISAVIFLFDILILASFASIDDPNFAVYKSSLGFSWVTVAEYIVLSAEHICFAILAFSYRSYAQTVNAGLTASMNPYPQAYPGFPVPPPPPVYTPYPGQPANPPYPAPQQHYDQPTPPEYTNPYMKSDVHSQAPAEAEPARRCPACGAPVTNPEQTNCSNCGYKF